MVYSTFAEVLASCPPPTAPLLRLKLSPSPRGYWSDAVRAGDTGNEHRAAVAAGRVRQALRDTAPLARRVLPRCGRELPREASGPRGAHLDRKVSQEGRRAIALAICFRHFVPFVTISNI